MGTRNDREKRRTSSYRRVSQDDENVFGKRYGIRILLDDSEYSCQCIRNAEELREYKETFAKMEESIRELLLTDETPYGVSPVLKDEILMPKSTDESAIHHLGSHKNHNEYYKYWSEYNEYQFGIVHYAGEVAYEANKCFL